MSRYDEAERAYKPIFISFPKNKPTLSVQKKQLIFFYLGSYFRKFTKDEILNNWNHHAFYWDENEHLILNLRLTSYNEFCDKINDSFDERENVLKKSYKDKNTKLPSYHDNIYFLYDFNDNKLAIQGYLIDSKHKKYDSNSLIEDISQFTDEDLDFILSHKMVNYDIRDKEIDDFLNSIKEEFPINRFYHFRRSYYQNTDIGYLTKIDFNHKEKKAILHITKYSIDTESLCTKKDDKYKIDINFLKKEENIENKKLKLLDDLYVKEKIYNERKSKIDELKNNNNSNKESIKKYQETIKSSQSAIINLENQIKERTDLINQKTEDLKNTIIEDIKLL